MTDDPATPATMPFAAPQDRPAPPARPAGDKPAARASHAHRPPQAPFLPAHGLAQHHLTPGKSE